MRRNTNIPKENTVFKIICVILLVSGVLSLILTIPATAERISAEDASKLLSVVTAVLNSVSSILSIIAALLSLLNMKRRESIESYRRIIIGCIIASAVQLSLRCINGVAAWILFVLILTTVLVPVIYLFSSRAIKYPVKRPMRRVKMPANF